LASDAGRAIGDRGGNGFAAGAAASFADGFTFGDAAFVSGAQAPAARAEIMAMALETSPLLCSFAMDPP
jgi:hypothetical protein